jgi:uncharacterized RDD family membrane protein YckC
MTEDKPILKIPEIDRPPYKYAGDSGATGYLKYFFKRGLAFVYDMIFLSLLQVGIIFAYLSHQISTLHPVDPNVVLYGIIFSTVYLYFTLFEYFLECTPGKYLIDLVCNTPKWLGAVWVLFIFIAAFLVVSITPAILGLAAAMIFIASLIFLSYRLYRRGAKPKHLMVISVSKRRITLKQAAIRNLGKVIPFVIIIDFLFALVTKRRQRLFDKIAKTVVIPGEALDWSCFGGKPTKQQASEKPKVLV